MKRNVSELKAKMNNHEVSRLGDSTWTVVSGTSGTSYEVHLVNGSHRCGCKFDKYTRRGESCGCSHVAAVVKFEAAEAGRKAYLHDGVEAAKRQHRPLVELGSGLFLTSRAPALA